MLFDNVVFNENSLYDILEATVDTDKLKNVGESEIEFVGNNSIILYTSLNKTNTELLKNGQYNENLLAFEYEEAALGLSQSEYVIKLAYNTKGMIDMLHPRAINFVEDYIKKNRLKKSEVEDMALIRNILSSTKFTGARAHCINSSKKAYTKTHILFESSKMAYILKASAVKVLDMKKK